MKSLKNPIKHFFHILFSLPNTETLMLQILLAVQENLLKVKNMFQKKDLKIQGKKFNLFP